jgi:hypothetical protein
MNASVGAGGQPSSAIPDLASERSFGLPASPNPVEFGSLAEARTRYGESTIVWASRKHQVEDNWWLGLSGTPHVDYNLALLHGPDSPRVVSEILSEIKTVGVPTLVMLAGPGLGAGDALAEDGWVCSGSLPFMGKRGGLAEDDVDVRQLKPHELGKARRLAASAFGVPEDVSAIVFSNDRASFEGCQSWGLFEGEELVSCVLTVWVGEFSVGWALSTSPQNQRAGYGRRLVRALPFRRLKDDGPPVGLLTATTAGERLYLQEGYVTLEHWQIWSRPRWVFR